jgi:hypothetical protein
VYHLYSRAGCCAKISRLVGLGSWRRPWAFYLATFLIVAAVAPHHHLDPIADLVSGGPSNSGTFAQIIRLAGQNQGFYPAALVQDEPCLACFDQDFMALPAVQFLVAMSFEPTPQRLAPPLVPSPALVLADAGSRAPPASA